MAHIHDRQRLTNIGLTSNGATRRQRSGSDISAGSSLFDSDKENAGSNAVTSSLGKRKSASSAMTTAALNSAAAKKRRLEGREQVPASQTARAKELSGKTETQFYDPDQNEATKRETTRQLRDLNANLTDSRIEFLQRGSRGIQKTIARADQLYQDVKQTSVAAIDSRLLVNVGDLAFKKINTMTLGDSSTGIDVDDFLTRCIQYMKVSPNSHPIQQTGTQRRQRQTQDAHGRESENDDADEDNVDLDWAYMGRTLCFPANSRPCLSSFLLGPLSTQKKLRQHTQRKATQRTQIVAGQATRPVELDQEALDKQESASLTQICSEIASVLARAQERGEQLVSEEVERYESNGEPPNEDQIRDIMRKHTIADNGGVPLFNFCVNPQSFGQTVENFFYVSFLIKEGRVGLDFDSDELPTLIMVEPKSLEERQESIRNQAVFTLDFETWEEIVKSFQIQESIIPHRREEEWEKDDGVIQPGGISARNRSGDVPTTSPSTARTRGLAEDDDSLRSTP